MNAARARTLTPETLVPIGSVFAVLAGFFSMARWTAAVELKGEHTAQAVAKVEQEQDDTTKLVFARLNETSATLGSMRAEQAAAAARLQMLIDHFGIRPKKP